LRSTRICMPSLARIWTRKYEKATACLCEALSCSKRYRYSELVHSKNRTASSLKRVCHLPCVLSTWKYVSNDFIIFLRSFLMM
jgi:hypothetical protein